LLYFNNKLITHNDSGDTANLYEIDTISGAISRTVTIANATNIDWEDITQDNDYIYIGDIGNNNGNRTNLKIYRISKSDYLNNTSINAEIINFSYEDQTDFSSQLNNTNFDAEAISVRNNNIVIFTKNWVNEMVNVYVIPKTIGTHIAVNKGAFNVNGLVTGSSFNELDDSFILCGYDSSLSPFLVYVSDFSGNNFFNGNIVKTIISSEIGQSQIEGVTNILNGKYFLSRENFQTTIAGFPIILAPKLYRFDNTSFTLSINDEFINNQLTIYPNPVYEKLTIKLSSNLAKITSVEVFDTTGKQLMFRTHLNDSINLRNLRNGLYFLKIKLEDNTLFFKKILKTDHH